MDRPNVLLIHTDQQRWDALGANGNEEIHTPNLDRLASDGVNFDRAFVNCPVCMPSRESYLTGQYPSQLDIYSNGIPLPEDVPTLATMFDPYDYHTANVGKLHFRPHANRDHRDPHPTYGFDQLELSDEPGCYPDAYRAWVREKNPDALDDVSVGLPPAVHDWPADTGVDEIEHRDPRHTHELVPFPADPGLTHTAFVADRTIDTIERHSDDQFCCVAGFYSPHAPWVVPQRFADLYDRDSLSIPDYPPEIERQRKRRSDEIMGAPPADSGTTEPTFSDAELKEATHGYYAMVSEVDHHVGRILDRLDDLDIADNTIVVFTSDHGEYLGEGLRFGKYTPTSDAVARVPLIVRWPDGITDPGRMESALVEAVDLVPTLLDCAGIQRPTHLFGQSLRPILEADTHEHRESVLIEHATGSELRTDQYWYKRVDNGASEELYDVVEDPSHYQNLTDDPAVDGILHEHRSRLLERLVQLNIDTERRRSWAY
jgi:arylsulfatase A-like enzyme